MSGKATLPSPISRQNIANPRQETSKGRSHVVRLSTLVLERMPWFGMGKVVVEPR